MFASCWDHYLELLPAWDAWDKKRMITMFASCLNHYLELLPAWDA